MADSRKLVSKRVTGGSGFDLFESEHGIEEIYADGFYGLMSGPFVSKTGLYISSAVQLEDDKPIEVRVLKTRLTMPTRSFAEMCVSHCKSLYENREALGLEDIFAGVSFANRESEKT